MTKIQTRREFLVEMLGETYVAELEAGIGVKMMPDSGDASKMIAFKNEAKPIPIAAVRAAVRTAAPAVRAAAPGSQAPAYAADALALMQRQVGQIERGEKAEPGSAHALLEAQLRKLTAEIAALSDEAGELVAKRLGPALTRALATLAGKSPPQVGTIDQGLGTHHTASDTSTPNKATKASTKGAAGGPAKLGDAEAAALVAAAKGAAGTPAQRAASPYIADVLAGPVGMKTIEMRQAG